MTKVAAATGADPTVTVAIEQHFPENRRILSDNLAYSILPSSMRALVQMTRASFIRDWLIRTSERRASGIWGGMLCRKPCIDEKLVESAVQIGAVVNLGAGYDTRVYRLPALRSIAAWEVDQPKNIVPKETRLQKLFGEVPDHVKLVPIDFDREELGVVLAAHRLGSRAGGEFP